MTAIHEAMRSALETTENAWLVVSLVPNGPGHMRITGQTLSDYRTWVNRQREIEFPACIRTETFHQVQADFRSVRFSDAYEPGQAASSQQGRMYEDGAGSFATQYDEGIRSLRGPEPERTGLIHINDEVLLGDVINSLRLLGAHAVEWAMAGGDAVVVAQIVGCDELSAALIQNRGDFPGVLQGSVAVAGDTPLSRHMVSLEDIAVPGPALLQAARPLAIDVVSPFGIPAPDQLPEGGSVDRCYFYRGGQEVMKWADRYGVATQP